MLGWLKNLGLSLKLNAVLGITLLIILLSSLFVLHLSIRNFSIQSGYQRTTQEAEVFQTRLAEAEEALLTAGRFLANKELLNAAVINQDTQTIRSILLTNTVLFNGIDEVVVVNAEGDLLTNYLTTDAHESWLEQTSAILSLARLGTVNTKLVVVDGQEQSLVMGTGLPLRDTSGTLLGAILISRVLDDAFLDWINFSRQDISMLLLTGTDLIARSSAANEQPDYFDQFTPDPALFEFAAAGQVATDNLIDLHNTSYSVAYVPVSVGGHTMGVVVILVNLENILNLQSMMAGTIAILLSVVALLAVITLNIAIRLIILRPVRHVQAVAQQIAQGDLEERVVIKSTDEIGVLGQAINEMAATLIQLIRSEEENTAFKQAVNKYMAFVDQVAAGDLTTRLQLSADSHSLDADLYHLGHNLNTMVEKLFQIAVQVRNSATNVLEQTTEIQAVNRQQLAGSTEQSSVVAQTLTMLEEVRRTVEETANQAQRVKEMALQSIDVSQTGQNAVLATIDGMAIIEDRVSDIAQTILELSRRTQQIGEIISSVSEIADQSKLLALNASIEAARAGEEGRGFGVVAVEIRQLAEQSQAATARVANILNEIQQATNTAVMVTEEGSKGTESGTQLVENAGTAIQDLAVVIQDAATAAAQIAASTQQQHNSMDQLVSAMQSIKEASTQTMLSTQQAENSTQELNEMAHYMDEAIAIYQLEAGG